VFNSRQMGKSSLRVHTMQLLQQDGVACGVIDITAIGSQGITPEQWYQGVMQRLARSFGIRKAKRWWREQGELSPVQRLGEFIEDVLLVEVSSPIVIFIDEIDSILRIEFKDDFFALIRACFNQRAENPAYRRLTFALLGVTTPSDLIQDKNRTPFNIGQAVDLHGFALEEVAPLAAGLTAVAPDPTAVMAAILHWTGGQPLLTQKLCRLVAAAAEPIAPEQAMARVGALVEQRILTNWEAQDEPEHLRTIRDRLLRDERSAGRLLGLYQQILRQGSISATDDPAHIALRLSGLVVEDQGQLRVYNRIYQRIFEIDWVNRLMSEIRPYQEEFQLWHESNYQDKSYLLRGESLNKALEWARERSLNQIDQQFLAQSQKLELDGIVEKINTDRDRIVKTERELADEKRLHEDLKRNIIEQSEKQKKLKAELIDLERSVKILKKAETDLKKKVDSEARKSNDYQHEINQRGNSPVSRITSLNDIKHISPPKSQSNSTYLLKSIRKEKISKRKRLVSMVSLIAFFLPLLGYCAGSQSSYLANEQDLRLNDRRLNEERRVYRDLISAKFPCGKSSLVSAFLIKSPNGEAINVYEKPSYESEVAGKIVNGEVNNMFLCVKNGFAMNLEGGWVPLNSIKSAKSDSSVKEDELLLSIETGGFLILVRESPFQEGQSYPLGFVDDGSLLILSEADKTDGWIKLKGRGWIDASLIKFQLRTTQR
jgi:hypothetical protein